MDIGVEISLYPLTADYIAAIHEFVERISADRALRVVTNSMSTQVFGGFEEVMDTLRAALGTSLQSIAGGGERAVFVMKVFGPLAPA
ncbi:MAG: YkoF family thiamine/hydroxymethylpyrimidine-binding protein [Steroidobacteraceae bacterium]